MYSKYFFTIILITICNQTETEQTRFQIYQELNKIEAKSPLTQKLLSKLIHRLDLEADIDPVDEYLFKKTTSEKFEKVIKIQELVTGIINLKETDELSGIHIDEFEKLYEELNSSDEKDLLDRYFSLESDEKDFLDRDFSLESKKIRNLKNLMWRLKNIAKSLKYITENRQFLDAVSNDRFENVYQKLQSCDEKNITDKYFSLEQEIYNLKSFISRVQDIKESLEYVVKNKNCLSKVDNDRFETLYQELQCCDEKNIINKYFSLKEEIYNLKYSITPKDSRPFYQRLIPWNF